ncbi:hypothetical protein MSKU9_1574 [Komagataeibacter diospyri]|uniref:Uncharacterized protein n=1 Tax=Komagataeibacter diospyri TaxID=1932662 RepID=A0A4P5NPW0_9PROT|nr:hypothetical protein MSKU9_1574 [Komagataeibacter diospyri]
MGQLDAMCPAIAGSVRLLTWNVDMQQALTRYVHYSSLDGEVNNNNKSCK